MLSTHAFMDPLRDLGEDPSKHEGHYATRKLVHWLGIERGLILAYFVEAGELLLVAVVLIDVMFYAPLLISIPPVLAIEPLLVVEVVGILVGFRIVRGNLKIAARQRDRLAAKLSK